MFAKFLTQAEYYTVKLFLFQLFSISDIVKIFIFFSNDYEFLYFLFIDHITIFIHVDMLLKKQCLLFYCVSITIEIDSDIF